MCKSMTDIKEITSRSGKQEFLKEVIERLKVGSDEKEMYLLCIEVLNDGDFEVFYKKIHTELTNNGMKYSEISLFTQQSL